MRFEVASKIFTSLVTSTLVPTDDDAIHRRNLDSKRDRLAVPLFLILTTYIFANLL